MDSEQFYGREAVTYDQRRWTGAIGRYVYETYNQLVAESVPITTGASYLEIGCGTGRFTAPLARQGIKLTAIDISSEMLEIARGKIELDGTHVNLLRADARDTGLESGSFDVIVSFNVINHVPQYERVISECARLLKRGGILVLGYPSLWSLFFPYAFVVNLFERSLHRGVYTRWPSSRSLLAQASALGLIVERRLGMFHAPSIRNRLISTPVAGMLRLLGPHAKQGALRSLATIQVVTFRKK